MTEKQQIVKLKNQLKTARKKAKKYYELYYSAREASNFFSRYE